MNIDKKDLPSFHPTYKYPLPPSQCDRVLDTGNLCDRPALPGGRQCQSHSTVTSKKAAATKVEAARLLLYGMADDAVRTLETLMGDGVADAVRLKAATEVLDRVGIRAGVEIAVEVTDNTSQAEKVREALGRLSNREVPRIEAADEPVDAEVV